MTVIIRWVLFSLAILFTGWLLPGVSVENFQSAMLLSFIMALVNVFLKPFLLIITLPVNILTLGLFTFILNAFLFMIAGYFTPGVTIKGFLPAFLGSFVLAVLGSVIYKIEK